MYFFLFFSFLFFSFLFFSFFFPTSSKKVSRRDEIRRDVDLLPFLCLCCFSFKRKKEEKEKERKEKKGNESINQGPRCHVTARPPTHLRDTMRYHAIESAPHRSGGIESNLFRFRFKFSCGHDGKTGPIHFIYLFI